MTDLRAQLAPVQAEVTDRLDVYRAFSICDKPSLALACESLRELASLAKQIERNRKEATDPLNASLKTIRGWFAPVERGLEECIDVLKEKVSAYHSAEAERTRAALKAASTAAAAGDMLSASAELATLRPAPRAEGVSVREVWSFEVTDANLVPREYLEVSDARIRAAIPRDGTAPAIPGVRFFKRASVAVRSTGTRP